MYNKANIFGFFKTNINKKDINKRKNCNTINKD